MYHRTDLIYQYDGSFDGFLCCVFRAVYQREEPAEITAAEQEQATLLEIVTVLTEPEKAARVYRSIPAKLGKEALRVVQLCFLSNLPDKEIALLTFLRLGYQVGSAVLKMLADQRVYKVLTAARAVSGEAHLLKGFTRFSDHRGMLIAEIEPKHQVLPILAGHFCARMPGESFLIFDRTHKTMLVCSGGHSNIMPMEISQLPRPDREEQFYRQLWTRFYDTVSIESRYNPKCRQTHMPQRFWNVMTEFQEENRPWALAEKNLPASAKNPSKIPCEDCSGTLQ